MATQPQHTGASQHRSSNMPVSEILQRLQKRAQIQTPLKTPPPTASSSAPAPQPASNTERVMDPVVARLKAARKRENEAKIQAQMQKRGSAGKSIAGKRPPRPVSASKPVYTSKQPTGQVKPAGKPVETSGHSRRPSAPQKKPKMSFNELMKKASSIDQSKMSINIKPKAKSPDAPAKGKTDNRAVPRLESRPVGKHDGVSRQRSFGERDGRSSQGEGASRQKGKVDRNHTKKTVEPVASSKVARAPIPIRKPSTGLQQRLKKTQQVVRDDSESDDMSSFIESDDDESAYAQQDYDRDEIWSIFNKGRKRSYYNNADDDSDDMEATGAEILEEEMRSKRNALAEDRREMEEEARLAALKKARRR